MQAAFIILLEPSAHNYVRNIQLKIYQRFKAKEAIKLDPHITIKYAIEIDDLGKLENYFDTLSNQVKEFEVEFSGIGSFENEKRVIYLDVVRNEGLTNLHLKILKDLSEKFKIQPGEFEGESLHFHTTLAYKDMSEETFRKIKDYLKNEKPSFKFRVREIGLYLLPDQDLNWFVYKVGDLAQ